MVAVDLAKFRPGLLIAMPELIDPNFYKTVVLLTDYKAETGARGFVLNRLSDLLLKNSIVSNDGQMLNELYYEVPLWHGGPTREERIWVLYDGMVHSHPDDLLVADGIYLARYMGFLGESKPDLPPQRMRVVFGYCIWAKEQLESEIAGNAWLTCPLSKDFILDVPHERMWETALNRLGINPALLKGGAPTFKN